MVSLIESNTFLLGKNALRFDWSVVEARSKHDIFKSRYQLGEFHHLCSELTKHSTKFEYCRMLPSTFDCTYMTTHFTLTYLLTPWNRVLLEKLTGSVVSQEIPRILWNPKVHYRTHKCSPSLPILSQLHPVPTSWRSILILFSHLSLGLHIGLFPSGFPTRTLCTPLPSPHTRHMPRPSHSSRFYHPHNIG